MLIWRLLICHRSDNRQEKIWKASANSCENMIEWQKRIEYAESVIRYRTPLVSQRNNPVATRQLIAKFEPNRVSHSLGLEGPMLPLPLPPSTRLSPSTSPHFPSGGVFLRWQLHAVICAGYHNRMGQTANRQKPSFWSFIRMVKDEESMTVRSARLAGRGNAPPARKAKYRKLEQRICELKTQYATGRKTLYDYWSALTHVIGTFA